MLAKRVLSLTSSKLSFSRSLFHASASKAAKLKEMLTNGKLNFIMEAHNGLSAKIVQ